MPAEVSAGAGRSVPTAWKVVFEDGTARQIGNEIPAFTLHVPSQSALERIL